MKNPSHLKVEFQLLRRFINIFRT